MLNPLALVGIVDSLLAPIQRLIALVLPDFIEKDLKDPRVRKLIVTAVDRLLVKQYPEAKLVPAARRKEIISAVLDIMLDKILLAD